MKRLIACCAALLTACATAQLDAGLKGLVGENIHEAINRLGYPDGQRTVMGDTVYIWSTNRNVAMPMNTTTTTTGAVGTTPYYGTTTGMTFVPMTFACTVQIATDANGAIKSYQWEGNQGGCRRYARGFSR
jgi:hypothetical protein